MTTYIVSSGTGTDGVTLNSGDTMTVLHGGKSIYTTLNGPYPGGSQDDFGITIGSILNATALERVESGGVAYETSVGTQGELNILSGGFASGTIVHTGGFVQNAGVMAATVVSNGGGVDNEITGVMRGTVLNGGELSQQGPAVTTGTIIHAGGEELAYNGYSSTGGLYGSIVDSGGLQLVDGATAFNTTVKVGGVSSVTGGNIIETLFLAGVSNNAVISSGGLEVVSGQIVPGQIWGESNATTVLSGGQENVHLGGQANATVVAAGGHMAVDGIASATVVSGGTQWDNPGGTTVGTVVKAGGYEIVYSGGVANSTVVSSGGFETVSRGTANGTRVSGGGFEGVFNGTTSGTVVSNGGTEVVYAGGVDRFSTISHGGIEFIRSGGVVSGGLISGGGTLNVTSGGTAVGHFTIAGGTLIDGGTMGSNTTVTFSGTGGELLIPAGGVAFGGTISGFAKGDTIDSSAFPYSPVSSHLTYSSGVLSVINGTAHTNFHLAGSYTASDFAILPDNLGSGGTLIKHT